MSLHKVEAFQHTGYYVNICWKYFFRSCNSGWNVHFAENRSGGAYWWYRRRKSQKTISSYISEDIDSMWRFYNSYFEHISWSFRRLILNKTLYMSTSVSQVDARWIFCLYFSTLMLLCNRRFSNTRAGRDSQIRKCPLRRLQHHILWMGLYIGAPRQSPFLL